MRTGRSLRGRTGGLSALAALCLALVVGACGPTMQARSVRPSGFLSDYSEFRKGKDGEALEVYFKPGADFSGYDKIIIDPVTVWVDRESGKSSIPQRDSQRLANHLFASLKRQLGQDYTVVHQPGPGVLRLRVAITEARASMPALDTISTFVPAARVGDTAKWLFTGTHSFVGTASIAAELQDAAKGERLAAAVDRRAGQTRFRGATSSWDDVEKAFDHWAERVRVRLGELRKG